MYTNNSNLNDINKHFDDKIKELNKILPKGEGDKNCSAWTFTSVLDVLGLDSFFFNNSSIPFGGGYGGFKSMYGWKGPCGAVSGGCMAIGIILGGQKPIKNADKIKIYPTTAKFVHYFEKEFGSVICQNLCGIDFNEPTGIKEYLDNNLWEKCYKYIIFAVDQVRKMTQEELEKKWT